jgi:uncharacterized protein YndB with AHSA1/START domain
MTGLAQTILPSDKPQIITTRLLNAPRDLVWKVLTSPEHIKHFWGPDGFTNSIKQMDVKVGGQWLFTMHGPDGKDWPNRIIYRTVTPPSYLAFDHDGGEDDVSGHRFLGELELFEEGKKTRIELRMTESSMAARDAVTQYAVAGGRQNLERLATYLAPMANPLNKFVIERSVPVSRQKLFEACASQRVDVARWHKGDCGQARFQTRWHLSLWNFNPRWPRNVGNGSLQGHHTLFATNLCAKFFR